MVSIRISKRLRKSPLKPQKQVPHVKKTRNKKSLTPTMKQISVKSARKSPITAEDSPASIDCLLRTPDNSKTLFIPEKMFKSTRKSTSTPIKQTSRMSSPRHTIRSVRISQGKTIQEGIQKVLNIPRSQKVASPKYLDPLLRIPSSTPMKKISDKTYPHSTMAKETAIFFPRRNRSSQKNKDCIPKKQTSDKTFSRRTKSLPIKSLATSKNGTTKFSPRRTRSSQKRLISEDTRTRRSLRILQQKASSETLCVTPTYESLKGTSSTCSEKQILPAKRARTSQKVKSNKRARESSTPKEPAKKIQAKTGHQKKSLVNSQKQAFQKKNSSAAINHTVAKYKKSLENIPIDNLVSWKRKAKSTGDCKKRSKRATLKKKRVTISEIKKADEGYEDDIYEFKKFDNFKNLIIDTPGSVFSASSMETPVLGFQAIPMICGKKTPKFKDCFSPRDLSLKRKAAQEYIYRIKNRKYTPKAKTPILPEKKRLEFDEAISQGLKLQEANTKLAEAISQGLKLQEANAKLAEDGDKDESFDDYFSDSFC